jgi:hypothetical protein
MNDSESAAKGNILVGVGIEKRSTSQGQIDVQADDG